MIRTIWYESELASITGRCATRIALVDCEGAKGWRVVRRELGARGGDKRVLRQTVSTLKKAQQIASAWVNYREQKGK